MKWAKNAPQIIKETYSSRHTVVGDNNFIPFYDRSMLDKEKRDVGWREREEVNAA